MLLLVPTLLFAGLIPLSFLIMHVDLRVNAVTEEVASKEDELKAKEDELKAKEEQQPEKLPEDEATPPQEYSDT